MKSGPDIVQIAALLGDPARANMLTALMGGKALTAGELAREAGVTAQTASSHLSKLEQGGLLVQRKQGRHRYFALSGTDLAEILEGLMSLAMRAGHHRTRTGPREAALRNARVCYDHLAGEMGVALLDGLIAQGVIAAKDESLSLTPEGEVFMVGFGLDLAGLRKSRRSLCRPCLDWSARRSHLGGGLGEALLNRLFELGWARRVEGSRQIDFTASGLAHFNQTFGRANAA